MKALRSETHARVAESGIIAGTRVDCKWEESAQSEKI